MTTNAEAPDMTNFVQQWMQAAAGIAPDPEPEEEPVTRPDDGDAFAEYTAPAVDRQTPARRAAIIAAGGLDAAPEPLNMTPAPAVISNPAPRMPPEPELAPEWPTESPATVEQAPGPAERHARTWRERNGLPRVKAKLSPADSTAGRRARYAAKRAAELGISYDDALAGIRTRPATTRAGRKAAQAEGQSEST